MAKVSSITAGQLPLSCLVLKTKKVLKIYSIIRGLQRGVLGCKNCQNVFIIQELVPAKKYKDKSDRLLLVMFRFFIEYFEYFGGI